MSRSFFWIGAALIQFSSRARIRFRISIVGENIAITLKTPYYSVHGFDQIDDAEAFYQKLATNNPNIFSCLGKVEIVEQQFTSSPIFDGLPRPSNDRASGTEEDDSVDWVKRRLIQGQAVGKAVCMAVWLL